jgi:hypothetical protein
MDYRFAIRCWQDQAGDENAKANVFVDGVQVLTEVEITATSVDSAQIITWESLGLTAPAAGTSFDIKVELVNEYYVDASTDRNILIDNFGYINKDTDGNYKKSTLVTDAENPKGITVNSTITDFDNYDNYAYAIPTAATGDQLPDDLWSSRSEDSFYTVPIYGGDRGATMTIPVIENSWFTA